ncbi:MAG: efflux transporter periplasmic adaptor subunit [Deltaproteobacteria bacterium]|nr:efflux transporter periplasmic adaptor subunit [Deltaproteobacteria bacterium]
MEVTDRLTIVDLLRVMENRVRKPKQYSRGWIQVIFNRIKEATSRMHGGLLAIFLFTTLVVSLGCSSKEGKEAPLPEVVVASVEQKDVPIFADWIGTAQGFNNATIRPQVKGYLLEIEYKQGSVVKKGQTLFKIDPREFKAQLDMAKGQLGQAKANLEKTKSHVNRYRPLAKQGAVSQQEFDDAVQNMLAAEASVATANAQVEQARLNLSWTKIVSPISGVAGISVTQIGDLVTTETELTTVSQLDPIKVNFPISEQSYLDFAKSAGRLTEQGNVSELGPVLELFLANGSVWPTKGTPFVVGRNVDESTGTILIEGRFSNPQNVLRPGQFARVRADVGVYKDALLVPQRAVSDVQGKYMISVVTPEDKVEVRTVDVGETVKEDWIITKGIKAGERVIVEGLQKARTGMKVKPVSQATFMKQDKTAETGTTAAVSGEVLAPVSDRMDRRHMTELTAS